MLAQGPGARGGGRRPGFRMRRTTCPRSHSPGHGTFTGNASIRATQLSVWARRAELPGCYSRGQLTFPFRATRLGAASSLATFDLAQHLHLQPSIENEGRLSEEPFALAQHVQLLPSSIACIGFELSAFAREVARGHHLEFCAITTVGQVAVLFSAVLAHADALKHYCWLRGDDNTDTQCLPLGIQEHPGVLHCKLAWS